MGAVKSAIDVSGPASARVALIGIFVICAIVAVHLARDFLTPVVLAFFIALTFRPAIRRLGRQGIPAWAATIGVTVVLMTVALAAIYVASGPISGWIDNAPEVKRQLLEKVQWVRDQISGVISFTEQVTNAATRTGAAPPVENAAASAVNGFGWITALSDLAGHPIYFVTMISAALVIAVFLMASGDLFYEKLVRVLPTLSDKKKALSIVYDVEHEVSTYLLTATVINAGMGIAVAIAFYLLDMPTPLLWALLGFTLNFIPYVGPVTGVGLAAIVALVSFDSMVATLLPPVVYACLIGIETQIVTPLFLSRRLRMNSVSILLALAFWAWAWGIAGIVLAVPLLVTFRVFCSHIESLWAIGEFIGESNNGAPPAATRQSSVEITSAAK